VAILRRPAVHHLQGGAHAETRVIEEEHHAIAQPLDGLAAVLHGAAPHQLRALINKRTRGLRRKAREPLKTMTSMLSTHFRQSSPDPSRDALVG
jgi:hypothetical protein